MKTEHVKTMPSRTEALAIAEECAHVLKERFGVREVYVFGSVTGEGPWHDRSDLDIAVEGLASRDYFRALSVLDEVMPPELELDLFPLEDMRQELVAKIRGEKKMPQDPIEAMKARISEELQNLERAVQGLQTFLNTASEQPSEIELRGAATYLHDFYNGTERIFERVAVTLDGGLPSGDHWHQLLLQQMTEAREGVRPAVIDDALCQRVEEYLKFRHRFRHTYGDELLWEKLRPLAEGVEETFAQLREQLSRFHQEVFESQSSTNPPLKASEPAG